MSAYKPALGDLVVVLIGADRRVRRVVPALPEDEDIDSPGMVWVAALSQPDDVSWLTANELRLATPEEIQAAKLSQLQAGGL